MPRAKVYRMEEGSICIICAPWNTQPDSDDTIIEMTPKDVGSLKAFCHKRQAIELLKAVEEKEKHPYSKIKVHKICGQNFTDPKRTSPPAVNESTFPPKKKKSVSFSLKEQCLICTSTALFIMNVTMIELMFNKLEQFTLKISY